MEIPGLQNNIAGKSEAKEDHQVDLQQTKEFPSQSTDMNGFRSGPSESDAQSSGVKSKSAAKLSSMIWLTTKHANCRMNAKQSPCKVTNDQCVCTAFAQRPLCCALCAPTELLLHCRRPYCAAMVTLRCPLCAERTPSDDVCFEYAQSARRRSAIYAIPLHQMAMPLRCCGDACVHTARTSAFCIF